MSDPTFHCKYCQEDNSSEEESQYDPQQEHNFSEEEMKQHLLNQHDQEVRADYPPTENPFYSHDCFRCSRKIQDDLRCDNGHDCIEWYIGMMLYGTKLGASD